MNDDIVALSEKFAMMASLNERNEKQALFGLGSKKPKGPQIVISEGGPAEGFGDTLWQQWPKDLLPDTDAGKDYWATINDQRMPLAKYDLAYNDAQFAAARKLGIKMHPAEFFAWQYHDWEPPAGVTAAGSRWPAAMNVELQKRQKLLAKLQAEEEEEDNAAADAALAWLDKHYKKQAEGPAVKVAEDPPAAPAAATAPAQSLSDRWNGLSPLTRNLTIGGVGGAGLGALAGYLSDSQNPRRRRRPLTSAITGALGGGALGLGGVGAWASIDPKRFAEADGTSPFAAIGDKIQKAVGTLTGNAAKATGGGKATSPVSGLPQKDQDLHAAAAGTVAEGVDPPPLLTLNPTTLGTTGAMAAIDYGMRPGRANSFRAGLVTPTGTAMMGSGSRPPNWVRLNNANIRALLRGGSRSGRLVNRIRQAMGFVPDPQVRRMHPNAAQSIANAGRQEILAARGPLLRNARRLGRVAYLASLAPWAWNKGEQLINSMAGGK